MLHTYKWAAATTFYWHIEGILHFEHIYLLIENFNSIFDFKLTKTKEHHQRNKMSMALWN